MNGPSDQDGFFIGWSGRTGRPLAIFLGIVAGAGLFAFLALAVMLSASVDDPGSGIFDFASGEQALRGVLTTDPYPLLHLPPDTQHPQGHTILLSGDGKHGASVDAATMENRLVEAHGYMLKRGTIDMLQVDSLTVIPGDMPAGSGAEAVQSLGRWRVTGEICDGKCYTGAMKPGAGLAHKACANLCLIGEIPPVLVSAAPVAGEQFLLLSDQNGHKMPDAIRDYVAIRVRLDGEIERRGDILVFKVNIAQAKLL